MNGDFERVFVRLIHDRLEDLALHSADLDIQSQGFGFEEIWFPVPAAALVNNLDAVNLFPAMRCMASRACSGESVSMVVDIGTRGFGRKSWLRGGCRERKTWSGCQQAGSDQFAASKPRAHA